MHAESEAKSLIFLELPAEALLHHLNTVAQYINEKLQSRTENTVRCEINEK